MMRETFRLQIYTEPNSEKIMMGSTVYCIHHKKGCKWTDELRKLKAHLNTCKYDALPCNNNCGAQIPRVLMEDHLKYTCPQRRTQCEFCGKDFIGATLEVIFCIFQPFFRLSLKNKKLFRNFFLNKIHKNAFVYQLNKNYK